MFARRYPVQVVTELMQARITREAVRLALPSPGQSLFLTAVSPGVVDVRRKGEQGRQVSYSLMLRLLSDLPDGTGPLGVRRTIDRALESFSLCAYPPNSTTRLQLGDTVETGRIVGLRMTTRDPDNTDRELDSVSRGEIDRDGDLIVVSVEERYLDVVKRPSSPKDLPTPDRYLDEMSHLRRLLAHVTADLVRERKAMRPGSDPETFVELHRMRTALVRMLERLPACSADATRDERTTLRMRRRDITRALNEDGFPQAARPILSEEDAGIDLRLQEIRAEAKAARELERSPAP